jgi:hypothetical protein
VFQTKGIRFRHVNGILVGEERTVMLNRSKISLNITMYPWDFAGLRVLLSTACGALVISEPVNDPSPYVPGVHFVQAAISDMPDVINYYVNRPEERQAIVEAAHSYITQELTMGNGVKKILREIGVM